ncbi:Glycosyl hydrolase family 20, catalytic domain [Mucilaginibacter gossypiicola]|uniref:beta-N-acetylhexosaminidase n=1 Tax=Mucilaginibacter gossypiicola TaxID=551995 RepID=A0A1H8I8I5_9SPHI|nr:family 20 glycosylhydrolase [Mucilaginibacter gossypiicola]SEN65110.1 Glycosyl hydrolase family 20, catalytic domain [Mucilaginibacter gossypiicola]
MAGKRGFFTFCCLLVFRLMTVAQVQLPVYPDSLFSTYYQQRVSHFKTLPKTTDDIIFLGNSITDGAEWSELFGDSRIKNRGISGDISAGVIARLPEIAGRRPAKVFLLIGVNDLSRNTSPDSVVKNIGLISNYLHEQTPATQVYVQSILPVNKIYNKFGIHTNKSARIIEVNQRLESAADKNHYTYINIHDAFRGKDGLLRPELTNDGLHLKGEGYLVWKHLLYPYVFDLGSKPSLLPLPQSLKWLPGFFPFYKCNSVIADKELANEANIIQQLLKLNGASAIGHDSIGNKLYIELKLTKLKVPRLADEAYHLQVSENCVKIIANTAHGIFNGIQTLIQLLRDNVILDACDITDWPAFAWRGYMVDVGRNYQSVEQLKQQINMMALYKLNTFHFHVTEDIAWRLAIKQYPELTLPKNMTRDKGRFYSVDEVKELQRFCRERHIEFIPEIDMPGHSAAFKRAFHCDMQSDTGMRILKNIIREVCETYKPAYLHIGGDEVKISNAGFLPEICRTVEQYGVKTIGWSPGGNVPQNTIRQLWMKEGPVDKKTKYIDSRHMYLNHMDPLESVTTLFYRMIGDVSAGNNNVSGGEICLWNDRAVNREEDLLTMNPVYPAMLAFAERSWRGGGRPGWTANIISADTSALNSFKEFENRLLDQKEQSFKGLPFPYYRQCNLVWRFYGPYNNGGDREAKFKPETDAFLKDSASFVATGGTLILRHWWYPLVNGLIVHPKENSTWYASAKIWCDTEGYKNFWIGFNNLSRSYATDTPDPGTWDSKGSALWVNGNMIKPPLFKFAGSKGNLESPLIDEGYEYRQPARIYLNRGWNNILVKLPVAGFTGKDSNNPVKWMFTFLPF